MCRSQAKHSSKHTVSTAQKLCIIRGTPHRTMQLSKPETASLAAYLHETDRLRTGSGHDVCQQVALVLPIQER